MEYSFCLNILLIVMNFISLFGGISYPLIYQERYYRNAKSNYINSIKQKNSKLSFDQDILFTSFEQENLLSPFFDIEINDNCTFPKEPILFGIYDGIKKGCDCLNSFYYEKKILPFQCNRIHYQNNCKDIKINISINLNVYEGKKFCVKKGKKFLVYLKDSSFTSCKENYKQCGILNNLNEKFCLPRNEECPLNYFKIDKNKEIKEEFEVITKPLSNGKYVHYSNQNINSSIIVLFNISENSKPCLDFKESNINFYYPLESKQSCYQKDEDFLFIDSINKLSFFKENNLYNLFKNIPNYPFNKIKNENISLYSRTFKLKSNIEIKSFSSFDSSISLQLNYVWAGIALILLIMILSGSSYNGKSCKCEINNSGGSDNCLGLILALIFLIICSLLCYCLSAVSYTILFSKGKLHTIYILNIVLLTLDIFSFLSNGLLFIFELQNNSIHLIALILAIVIPLILGIFLILYSISLYKLMKLNNEKIVENDYSQQISNDNENNFMSKDNYKNNNLNNNNSPVNNNIYIYHPPNSETNN